MKKKLIALWHKIKTVKKRVWLILSALLAITLVITWNSLPYIKQREIKAMFGNIEAKRAIESENIQYICGDGSRKMNEWVAKGVFNRYAELNALDELLDWAVEKNTTKGDCKIEQVKELSEIASSVLKENSKIQDKRFLEAFEKLLDSWRKEVYYGNLVRFYVQSPDSYPYFYFREVFDRLEQKYIANNDYRSLIALADGIKERSSAFNDDLIRLYGLALKFDQDNKWAKYNIAELTLKKDPQNQEALNTINQLAKEEYGYALVLLGDRAKDYSQNQAMRYYTQAANIWDQHSGVYKAYKRLFFHYHRIYVKTDAELLELLGQRDEYVEGRYNPKVFDFINEKVKHDIVNENIYVAEQVGRILFLKKKYEEAEKFFQEILQKTNRSEIALSKLGDIYYQGLGRRQELEKAHEYYGKACDLKDQYACDKYREVNEKIYRAESKR